jgi:hypothetical protein
MIGEPPPPIEWDVEPLIARGERVVVFGEYASMKSWLLPHLGLHLAAGQPWLGKFTITQPRAVLYVDEEMSLRTLCRRIVRLATGAGLEAEELRFRVLSRAGVRFDAAAARQLLTALDKAGYDPDVVIVETFRRVLVGNENDAKDVAEFWRNVDPIVAAGKTLIVSHHMRKPRSKSDKAGRHRASGSTDVLAGADAAFAIQRLSPDSIAIQCEKSREAEEAARFIVTLDAEGTDGPASFYLADAPSGSPPDASKFEEAIKRAMAFLIKKAPSPVTTGDVLAALAASGVAQRTAQRVLPGLEKRGRIQKVRHGQWVISRPADGA